MSPPGSKPRTCLSHPMYDPHFEIESHLETPRLLYLMTKQIQTLALQHLLKLLKLLFNIGTPMVSPNKPGVIFHKMMYGIS